MLSSASQAVFISGVVQRHFEGTRYSRIPQLMFNGLDNSLFHCPQAGDRDAARVEFALLGSAGLRLLFVGRFVEKKGLAALRELAINRPDCEFVLVGDGPINPASWGLQNVTLLGRRTRQELARLYRACDGLVLPSIGEGYPLVVQEALASGLSVYCGLDSAAADPGAMPSRHGVAVDPNNPEVTARRFRDAIAAQPPSIQVNAAAYASARYNWDVNAAALEAMISSTHT